MGGCSTCCKTCNCPRNVDSAPGRRILLNELITKESASVKVTTEYIEKADGTLLFGKLFEPRNPSDAKAMICYCIGFGDHTEFHLHDIGIEYAEQGFIVFMCDWKGHGRSDGDFIHIQDFDIDIIDEGIFAFDYAINKYIKSHPTYINTIHKPNNYFLSGSSMGGAIAIRVALKSKKNKWKGLVITSPMVSIKEEMQPPQWAVICLENCCLPCCPKAKLIPNKVNFENLSTDEEIRKYFEDDPVFYDQPLSLITGWNLMNVTKMIETQKNNVKLPLYICHGDDDKVTDCDMSKVFYDGCGCNDMDKNIKIYKGRGHALFQEDENVCKDTVEWMIERINMVNNDIQEEKNDDNVVEL